MTAELPETRHVDVCFEALSENALLITWPEKISPGQHQYIINYRQQIHRQLPHLLIDSVASYNSLMIYYHFKKVTTDTLKSQLTHILKHTKKDKLRESAAVEVPVYYGSQAGWDLPWVARQSSLTIPEVITLHQSCSYRAYALGFTPGFCYLGSLPPPLQLPRRTPPRLAVPKGAVAIAGLQTAVYPNASPGGWHILGQTPLPMFTIKAGSFQPLISPGQEFRFTMIDAETFNAMGGEVVRESK